MNNIYRMGNGCDCHRSSGLVFAGQSFVGSDFDGPVVGGRPPSDRNQIVLNQDDFEREVVLRHVDGRSPGRQVEPKPENFSGRSHGRHEPSVLVVLVDVGHVLVVQLALEEARSVVVAERGRVLGRRLEGLEVTHSRHAEAVLEAIRGLKCIDLSPGIKLIRFVLLIWFYVSNLFKFLCFLLFSN